MKFVVWVLLSFFVTGVVAQESGGLQNFGRNVKDAMDSIRLKDRFKNTTQGVVISSLEGKARRQEKKGNLEDATLIYLRVVNKYREASDSLGVARTYNKIASLYIRRNNPQIARSYMRLASEATGDINVEKLSALNPHVKPEPKAAPKTIDTTTAPPENSPEPNNATEVSENELRDVYVETTPPAEVIPVQPPRRAAPSAGFESLLSQLEAQRDSADLLRLAIEDQEKNLLILQQQYELEQQYREREERFRWTLIGGVVAALLLALLLYRQFRIKRKAHIQTQAALDQLAEAHEELKETQMQLVDAEKMASLGLLTAGIAHEINNPINFISGNIEPLKEDIKDLFAMLKEAPPEQEEELEFIKEEVKDLLAGIEEGAERTTEIVSGLRDFSRLDQNDLQEFDVHSGIASTLTLLRHELKDRIEIEKSFGELPKIEGFPGKINQVLMNGLNNAIQAIDGKGSIGIITAYDESRDTVSVSILDSGKGIPQEIVSKVFDPFFTTKEVGEGTGLGLAISKGIVEQHHGNIEIKSEINIGTELSIILPRKQPQDKS